jgi:hypothetical protein
MRSIILHPLVNIALLNVGWFAAVGGAAIGWPLLGPAFTLAWLGLHLRALGSGWRREAKFFAAAGTLGFLLDSCLVLGGAFAFPSQAQLGFPSTIWMVALWLNFAAGMLHGFRFILARPGLAAALGAVGGPLAYWGGVQLGAVVPAHALAFTLAVAVEWILAPVLLIDIIRRIDTSAGSARGRAWAEEGGT